MALENPYCTVNDVISETGNSDSGLVETYERYINLASRFIDDFTKKDFLPHSFTSEPFIPRESQLAGRHLTVPWKIRSVDSVVIEQLEIPSELYEIEGRSIVLKAPNQLHARQAQNYATYIVKNNSRWPTTKNSIEIYGEFGCTPPDSWDGSSPLVSPCSDLPSAIRLACAKIASAWSNEKRRERGTMDGERVSILDDRIPDDALRLLKRYSPLFV